MAQRMFGLETEYALAGLDARGARVDQGRVLSAFMELARKNLAHLPDRNSHGLFLENGSRFYVDHGGHPELAICEVVDPWDACRYILAGDRILAKLAGPTTWGCHENYAHQADPQHLPKELVPHLVSRIIYTGAGGFNNRSPGVEFMLSPRAAHPPSPPSFSAPAARSPTKWPA